MQKRHFQAAADLADYTFENHGSIWLCRPTSDTAYHHLRNHVDDDNSQWLGDALAVEPRYVESLAAALEDNGFSTEL